MPGISPSGKPQAMPKLHTHTITRKNEATLAHSSHPPPVGTGMNAWTYRHPNTQLVHMYHRRANPKGPCTPRWKIYAHREGPIRGSGDMAYSDLLIGFPRTDDSLPAGAQSDNYPFRDKSQDSSVTFNQRKYEREHMCLFTGRGDTERQVDVNLSDKAPACFLFSTNAVCFFHCPSFITTWNILDCLTIQPIPEMKWRKWSRQSQ